MSFSEKQHGDLDKTYTLESEDSDSSVDSNTSFVTLPKNSPKFHFPGLYDGENNISLKELKVRCPHCFGQEGIVLPTQTL